MFTDSRKNKGVQLECRSFQFSILALYFRLKISASPIPFEELHKDPENSVSRFREEIKSKVTSSVDKRSLWVTTNNAIVVIVETHLQKKANIESVKKLFGGKFFVHANSIDDNGGHPSKGIFSLLERACITCSKRRLWR